jgi:hypothetical protein
MGNEAFFSQYLKKRDPSPNKRLVMIMELEGIVVRFRKVQGIS